MRWIDINSQIVVSQYAKEKDDHAFLENGVLKIIVFNKAVIYLFYYRKLFINI